MYLRKLRLRNFRNYVDQVFVFSPHVNVFVGENAQGKTNLLEAICLLSTGRSFRTSSLEELVQKGSEGFFIEAILQTASCQEFLRISYKKKVKLFTHNSSSYSSFKNLLGMMPSVIHLPSDIELISGAPATRRKFLNIHLAQKTPLYAHYLFRYNRAMKQRNALLKSRAKRSSSDIWSDKDAPIWEGEMARSGAYLTWMRQELLQRLAPLFEENIAYFSSQKETARCLFSPSIPPQDDERALEKQGLYLLQKNRVKETYLGSALFGAHRDDFYFKIDALPSKPFASEGQKRSIAASIRFAEWEELSQSFSDAAIFCVDDFGLGLDSVRKRLFQEKTCHLGQVFLTAPEEPSSLETGKERLFFIQKGALIKVV
ncbi:MAG: DNA replication/repair protein RecF [Chlamydiota bacterium]